MEKKEWFGYSEYFEQMKRGMHGSFSKSLAEAWMNASFSNRKILVEAFPDLFPDTYQYY